MPVIGMFLARRPVFVRVSLAVRAPVLMPVPIVMWAGVFQTIITDRLWWAAAAHFLPWHRAIIRALTTARCRYGLGF